MRGITMVELLIVIAIIGAMTSVAVITASTWGPNFRLGSAESRVVNAIRDGQSRAIKQNADVHYSFTSTSIQWACAGDSEVRDFEHITLDSWDSGSVTNPGYNSRAQLIDGSGNIYNSTVSIRFSNEAGNCTVQLHPFGAGLDSKCDT